MKFSFNYSFFILVLALTFSFGFNNISPAKFNSSTTIELCDDLEVKHKIEKENFTYTVKFEVERAIGKPYFILENDKGKVINNDFESSVIENLKPGTYVLICAVKGQCKVRYRFIIP